jgi:hypothetical protein
MESDTKRDNLAHIGDTVTLRNREGQHFLAGGHPLAGWTVKSVKTDSAGRIIEVYVTRPDSTFGYCLGGVGDERWPVYALCSCACWRLRRDILVKCTNPPHGWALPISASLDTPTRTCYKVVYEVFGVETTQLSRQAS